ncbi:MAG: DUF3035 domain-containing protein [Alphaproteobacteria bacterium]|nr:DUF3035 domain-containing protein [Alphaproteobacteria bacterium]MDE1987737.1 DUF3035 domain-containing protein [Alphaproteobacteria bacterium]MDE2164087.1 DUF3035 domain-containing protein [Alphaproteobacteria bacterium]MDE2264585.1 DUF3035 domain-containing protein [Alphaproteobacteria bacterium]MDE2500836.1 DUF3035 domain-containing protein [Alphaproteobacteria bacterium]
MVIRSSYMLRAAVLIGVGIALCSCESMREAAGLNKNSPDEFAVLTKAPLVIPPDYNLMPPRPGAPPTNQTLPTESAESALFGEDPAKVASQITGNYSQGEKLLLAYAGIANSDPNIRQELASDNKAMVGADDSFTNEVLFWDEKKKDTAGTAVNADEAAAQLAAKKAGDKNPEQAAPKPQEKSGWFDGWFDWL